jgi:hypothetical protein
MGTPLPFLNGTTSVPHTSISSSYNGVGSRAVKLLRIVMSLPTSMRFCLSSRNEFRDPAESVAPEMAPPPACQSSDEHVITYFTSQRDPIALKIGDFITSIYASGSL